jgi:hypothetical protein
MMSLPPYPHRRYEEEEGTNLLQHLAARTLASPTENTARLLVQLSSCQTQTLPSNLPPHLSVDALLKQRVVQDGVLPAQVPKNLPPLLRHRLVLLTLAAAIRPECACPMVALLHLLLQNVAASVTPFYVRYVHRVVACASRLHPGASVIMLVLLAYTPAEAPGVRFLEWTCYLPRLTESMHGEDVATLKGYYKMLLPFHSDAAKPIYLALTQAIAEKGGASVIEYNLLGLRHASTKEVAVRLYLKLAMLFMRSGEVTGSEELRERGRNILRVVAAGGGTKLGEMARELLQEWWD